MKGIQTKKGGALEVIAAIIFLYVTIVLLTFFYGARFKSASQEVFMTAWQPNTLETSFNSLLKIDGNRKKLIEDYSGIDYKNDIESSMNALFPKKYYLELTVGNEKFTTDGSPNGTSIIINRTLFLPMGKKEKIKANFSGRD